MALQVGELYAKLTVDSKGFDKEVNDAERKMNSLGNSGGGAFDNIGRMALRAVGGVSALGVAVAAVAVTGAAVSGIGASMMAAGVAAGAYGAVAVSALKGVFESASEVDKIQQKIDNADSAKERIAAEQELAKVYEGMSEAQRGALTELQNFKSFWGDFVKQFETPIFEAFGESLALLKNIFTGLAPTITSVSEVVKELIAEMNNSVISGDLAGFFTWLETNGAEAIYNFAHIAGNAISGFFHLIGSFSEHGASMEEGLLRLTERFNEWAKGLSKSEAFKQFIDYVKTNGPVLMQVLGDVFSVLGSLITILAPIGQVLLDLISKITGPLAEGFRILVEKLSGAKDSFDQFKTMMTEGFKTAWSVIEPLLTMIGEKVMEVFSAIIEWWNTNGQSFLTNVQEVFNGIWGVIQFIMPTILDIVSRVFDGIKTVITGALDVISGIFAVFAGLFTGNWSKFWDGILQILKGLAEMIWGVIKATFIGKIISTIGEFVSKSVSKFQEWKAQAAEKIQSMVTEASEKFNDMKSQISEKVEAIRSSISEKFDAAKKAITEPIEEAKKVVTGIIDDIVSAFSNMKISIPAPKLPKINVGSTTLFGGEGGPPAVSIPTFSLDWFKTGGIATGPAIAGIGEAGSEAIIPMSGRRMKPFANEIAKQIGGSGGGVTINMYGDNYYSDDMDISYVSEKLGDEVDRKLRLKGGR